jgi:HlyD family secretion protein
MARRFKKLIIVVNIVVLLMLMWWFIRTYVKWDPVFAQATYAMVKRANLRIPVTYSGFVEAAGEFDIKSKASGEVQAILVTEGQFARADEVLIELDKKDEQRNVDRAENALEQATSQLIGARIDLRKRRIDTPLSIANAEKSLESAKSRVPSLEAGRDLADANLQQAKSDLDHFRGIDDEAASIRELERFETQWKVSNAQLRQATSQVTVGHLEVVIANQNLERARLGELDIERAASALRSAEASYKSAKVSLDEAQQRFKETTIKTPVDGLVIVLAAKLGSKIQSGVTSLTGGTVLARIADLSDVYVVAQVDEVDISGIAHLAPPEARPQTMRAMGLSEGSDDVESYAEDAGAVEIEVESYPDEVFQGLIERISPQGNPAFNNVVTFDVRVKVVSENRHKLLLNSQAYVNFYVQTRENVLVIPVEAVNIVDGVSGVNIPRPNPPPGEDEWKFQPIETGIDDNEFIEVVSGLKNNQKIYVKLPIKIGRQDQDS